MKKKTYQRQNNTEAKAFNRTSRYKKKMYIDDIMSINNLNFANLILLIYPKKIWNKRNSFLCLISWQLPQISHQWLTSYQTLTQETISVLPLKYSTYWKLYTNRSRVWSLYFTTHTLRPSLQQFVFTLFFTSP